MVEKEKIKTKKELSLYLGYSVATMMRYINLEKELVKELNVSFFNGKGKTKLLKQKDVNLILKYLE